MQSRVLEELMHKIADLLSKIYNLSCKLAFAPEDWETTSTKPVFKRFLYKPFSLTSVSGKWVENIIKK